MIPTASGLVEITRRRTSAGHRDEYGRWVEGDTTETRLLASVQPLVLEDIDVAGNAAQLSERVKAFVLPVEYAAARGDRLTWGADVLAWGADVLRWAAAGGLQDAAAPVLAAAFDEAEADRIIYSGRTFVVESSVGWGSHTEAVLLREP